MRPLGYQVLGKEPLVPQTQGCITSVSNEASARNQQFTGVSSSVPLKTELSAWLSLGWGWETQEVGGSHWPHPQVVKDVADEGNIADPALQGSGSELLPGLVLLLQPIEEAPTEDTLAGLLALCLWPREGGVSPDVNGGFFQDVWS